MLPVGNPLRQTHIVDRVLPLGRLTVANGYSKMGKLCLASIVCDSRTASMVNGPHFGMTLSRTQPRVSLAENYIPATPLALESTTS